MRYARRKRIEHPAGFPEDIEAAIRLNLAHALGGGYDKDARRLKPEVRAAVWERDKGRCVMCGEPGEEIDHISGPSSDLSNLRLLCRPCHGEVTQSHMVPITDEETKRRHNFLLLRMASEQPLRPCDDPNWNQTRAKWRRAHVAYG